MAAFQPGSKRKRLDDVGANPSSTKRQRKFQLIPLKYPFVGSRVWIHFTDDCTCNNENKLKCSCDLWFGGIVASQSENNKDGNQVFVVMMLMKKKLPLMCQKFFQ